MEEKQKKAFKESIKHWKRVVKDPKGESTGITNCALCALYNDKYCKGCPIYNKTGKSACHGTPYDIFSSSRTKGNAMKELIFLQDLYIECTDVDETDGRIEKAVLEATDITKDIKWKVEGIGKHYCLLGFHGGKEVALLDLDGSIYTGYQSNGEYIIEREGDNFRVLKKKGELNEKIRRIED